MREFCVKGEAALWLHQLLGKDSWLWSVLIFCEENWKGAFSQTLAAKQAPDSTRIRTGRSERRVSWLDWALGCHPVVGTHFSPHLQTTPHCQEVGREHIWPFVAAWGSLAGRYRAASAQGTGEVQVRSRGASAPVGLNIPLQSHSVIPHCSPASNRDCKVKHQHQLIKREMRGFPWGLGSHN